MREQIHNKLLLEDRTDSFSSRDKESLPAKLEALSSVLLDTASGSLGFCSRKHQDRFDDNSVGMHELL